MRKEKKEGEESVKKEIEERDGRETNNPKTFHTTQRTICVSGAVVNICRDC